MCKGDADSGRPSGITLVKVLLAIGLSAFAYGQAITGTIIGTVRDASGGLVVGAKVTVANQNTGISSQRITDSQGNYTAPQLPPGTYKITVEYPGFRMAVSPDNTVQVNQTARVDFEVQPGQVTEQVEVTAAAPLVESTTSEVGHVISDQQIQSLPLNGRLFSQLVALTPGAVQAGFGDFGEDPAAAGARSPVNATVNGLPWSGNNYTVDGVSNSEPLNAFINISPPLDSIQEFKVQTNNPSAEYGSFGGAIINLTMKSGTNEFHGSAFEFLRNDKLNARDFFAATRAPFKTNQFGGTFGGPIKRNKLFFFMDYQGMRERQGRTFNLTVPTALQRQGILTEGDQPPIYDPTTGQPFPGNVIPPGRQDPITSKVAQGDIWPLPNRPGLVNNFLTNNSLSAQVDQFDVKVDGQLSEHDQIIARESFSQRDLKDPAPGTVFMMNNPNANNRNQNAVAGYIHTFSPNAINEFRVGFNRYATSHFGNDYPIPENNNLGMPNGNILSHPETLGIAEFDIPGFKTTGAPGWTNAQRIANIFQYTDTFTLIRSRHTFKFGGDIRRVQSTLTNPQTQPRGQFQFDQNITSNQGAAGTGSAWASFLLGYPWSVARDLVNTRPGIRMWFDGLYAQDDFRVSHSVTLNLGLRWDLFTHPVEKYDRQTNFNLATGLIDTASSNNRGPNVDNFYGSWGPRVGIAYSPDEGKTAIRAAYGISYFPDNFGATGGTLERNYPLFQISHLVTPSPFTIFRSVSQGPPDIPPVELQPQIQPPPGFDVYFVPGNFRQDMAQMWNFGIQRQLPGHLAADAAYVATRGTHLYRDRDLNVPFPGPGPLPERRPFASIAPDIPAIHQRNGDGASSYQSAQFKVVKQFSAGLSFLASYTISKSIDNVSNVFFPYADVLNRGLSAGFKQVDIPQNFVFSYTYELPFGRGRHWATSGALSKIAGGWSVNGITTFRSGQPLFVQTSTSLLNTGTSNLANITCKTVPRPKQVNQWFDTSCFTDPPPYTFGNSGIGHVRGPGLNNWDFSLFKTTYFDEKRMLELRAEFFNIFNQAHFANPGNTLGTSSFGVISSTGLPSREIQLGAKFSF
jgi:hypothetical protein